MSESQPEKLFENIESFIAKGRQMLKDDALIDASELEGQVKTLCESVLSLSKEERLSHTDRMQALLTDLTQLGDDMTRQKDTLATQLQQMDQKKKAHQAYARADAVDGYGKDTRKDDN